jgi:hypothetical protein
VTHLRQQLVTRHTDGRLEHESDCLADLLGCDAIAGDLRAGAWASWHHDDGGAEGHSAGRGLGVAEHPEGEGEDLTPCSSIVARAIKADESTVHRWRAANSVPSPIFLDRLDALGELLGELRRTVKDQVTARYWLDRNVPALQGRTPREVLLAGRIERLTGMLTSFNAGVTL